MRKLAKNILGSLTVLFTVYSALAQPSNDNCAGATFITPGATCNPITSSTLNATQSMSGCSGSANDDVWFVFVANTAALDVVVQGSAGFDPVVQGFSGTCGGSSLGCSNNTGIGGMEVLSLTGLINGVTYWVRVYHAAATNPTTPDFTICVSEPIVMPPCSNSTAAGNTCSQSVLICEVDGYCGNTSATYSSDSWSELSSSFCGSLENNSFINFVAESSSVSLNVWITSSTDNSGIQIMIFDATNCSGPVSNYYCEYLQYQPGYQSVYASGLTPGNTYYMMIDGYAGDVCDYVIGVNDGIQVSSSITTIGSGSTICLGDVVNLQASGGNGVYNWTANPDLDTLQGTDVVATPTTTGTHTYEVTSYSSNPQCPNTSSSQISIDVVPQVNPYAGADDTVCLGTVFQLNGTPSSASNSIAWNYNTSGISPTPTISFSPNFNVQNPNVTVNQPGVYRFIFRETSNVCGMMRDTMLMYVVDPQQTLSFTQPSCFGSSDGEIQVDNPFADEYSFDGGNTWVTDSFAVGYTAGTYTVCSRNSASGCDVCSDVTVTDPAQIGISVSNDTLICENGTATLVAQGSGGTMFTYYWSEASMDNQGTQSVNPTAQTTYSVYAENEFGCTSPTEQVIVNLRDPISGTITADQLICPGDNASLEATAADGFGQPYTFTWSTGEVQNGPQGAIVVSPASDETFTVTITDNCESTPLVLSTNVSLAPVPDPQFMSDYTELCEPAVFNLTNMTDPNLTDHLTWDISNGDTYTDQENIATSELNAGQYDVTMTVISPDGCVGTTTWDNYFTVFPKPKASFKYSPDPVTMFNTEVNFNNYSDNAISYNWTFEQGDPATSGLEDPTVVFPDGQTGDYEVMLIVTSPDNCLDTALRVVNVAPEVILYAPNTFTPDGDEFNQHWRVYIDGISVNNFELKVYNRWGEIVFESHDPEATWDGTYLGKLIPQGTYIWTIKAADAINDDKYEFKGHVNIIR